MDLSNTEHIQAVLADYRDMATTNDDLTVLSLTLTHLILTLIGSSKAANISESSPFTGRQCCLPDRVLAHQVLASMIVTDFMSQPTNLQ